MRQWGRAVRGPLQRMISRQASPACVFRITFLNPDLNVIDRGSKVKFPVLGLGCRSIVIYFLFSAEARYELRLTAVGWLRDCPSPGIIPRSWLCISTMLCETTHEEPTVSI